MPSSSLLSSFRFTLSRRLFTIRMLIAVPAACVVGFLIEFMAARFLERSSLSLIVAAIAVYLSAIGTLLSLLPADTGAQRPWNALAAWLQSLLLCGAALGGVALAPTHHESVRTFLSIWALFAGHAAIVAAAYGMLSTLFFPAVRPARQCMLLGVGLMTTALFWSRGLIETTAQSSSDSDALRAAAMADAVVKLSPPVTVAEAWHQECDASRRPSHGNDSRFDLVHGPLTYNVWLGSFQMVAYPDLFPPPAIGDDSQHFNPGLLLAMLAWALPVLILCEVLAHKRPLPYEG